MAAAEPFGSTNTATVSSRRNYKSAWVRTRSESVLDDDEAFQTKFDDRPWRRDVAIFCGLAALFVTHMLVLLRFHTVIDWPWYFVLMPCLLAPAAAAVFFISRILCSVASPRRDWVYSLLVKYLFYVMAALLVMVFVAFASSKIEEMEEGLTWLEVFSPLLVVQMVALLRYVYKWQRKWRRARASGEHLLHSRNLTRRKHWHRAWYTSLQIPPLVLSLLVPLELEGTITWPWTVVFIPVWVFLPLVLLATLFHSGKAGLANVFGAVVVLFSLVIPVLLFSMMLCMRMDGQVPFSLVGISIPLFVLYALLGVGRVCMRQMPEILAFLVSLRSSGPVAASMPVSPSSVESDDMRYQHHVDADEE